jgi:hypothetical protein
MAKKEKLTKPTATAIAVEPVLGCVIVSKSLFLETMEAIEKQYKHDQKCNTAFKTLLPNDYTSGYDNHWVNNELIKYLQKAMNDEHAESWIEYFLWELDFGKKYRPGSVIRKDKTHIDLSNTGKLYDYLIEENKSKCLHPLSELRFWNDSTVECLICGHRGLTF